MCKSVSLWTQASSPQSKQMWVGGMLISLQNIVSSQPPTTTTPLGAKVGAWCITTLHYITQSHYANTHTHFITFQYITPHYIAPHHTTFHCILHHYTVSLQPEQGGFVGWVLVMFTLHRTVWIVLPMWIRQVCGPSTIFPFTGRVGGWVGGCWLPCSTRPQTTTTPLRASVGGWMLVTFISFYHNVITFPIHTQRYVTSFNHITSTHHTSLHSNTLHQTTLHHIALHCCMHHYTVSIKSKQGGLVGRVLAMFALKRVLRMVLPMGIRQSCCTWPPTTTTALKANVGGWMLATLMSFYHNFMTFQNITHRCITTLNHIRPTHHTALHPNTVHHTTLHHIALHCGMHHYTVSLKSKQGGLVGWVLVMFTLTRVVWMVLPMWIPQSCCTWPPTTTTALKFNVGGWMLHCR
jgi:hypothetical protein